MQKQALITRFLVTLAALTVFAAIGTAQPVLVPAQTTPEILCSVDTTAAHQIDTVVSLPDSNGFYTIFDGRSFKGWFQNCRSSHSSGDRVNGGIFRVDSVRKAIYAMSRNQVGGLLSTKKKYAHYELMFEWWPQYGNDGGVFNRYAFTSSTSVASNQMVLDYLGASGVFSYYSEAGFPGGRNGRPWSYNSVNTMTIPGSGGSDGSQGAPDLNNWSNQTKRQNLITGYGPTDIGCNATTGCVQADYVRLWNPSGWMQVRQIYYGGLTTTQPSSVTAAGDKIREFTFFRKHYPLSDTLLARQQLVNDTAKWVTVVQDSMVLTASQVNTYQKVSQFAFQIHSGNRYVLSTSGGRGSWYRDIKVRELTALGIPTYIATSISGNRPVKYDLKIDAGRLVGSMDLDHVVTVTDLKGRVLLEYSAFAGNNIARELPQTHGVMLVRVKSTRGTQVLRYNNLAAR
jgi:hypothetical protein